MKTKQKYFKLFTLLLIAILFYNQSLTQKNESTNAFHFGYFNEKFGSHGLRAGHEFHFLEKNRDSSKGGGLKHNFVIKSGVGFYNHKRNHLGLLVNATVGYRYTSKRGLTIEPFHLGFGYLHTFINSPVYGVEDEGFVRRRFQGNPSFILPYVQFFGMGYDFRQRLHIPLSLSFSLDFYFQHRINDQIRFRLATPITFSYFF